MYKSCTFPFSDVSFTLIVYPLLKLYSYLIVFQTKVLRKGTLVKCRMIYCTSLPPTSPIWKGALVSFWDPKQMFGSAEF